MADIRDPRGHESSMYGEAEISAAMNQLGTVRAQFDETLRRMGGVPGVLVDFRNYLLAKLGLPPNTPATDHRVVDMRRYRGVSQAVKAAELIKAREDATANADPRNRIAARHSAHGVYDLEPLDPLYEYRTALRALDVGQDPGNTSGWENPFYLDADRRISPILDHRNRENEQNRAVNAKEFLAFCWLAASDPAEDRISAQEKGEMTHEQVLAAAKEHFTTQIAEIARAHTPDHSAWDPRLNSVDFPSCPPGVFSRLSTSILYNERVGLAEESKVAIVTRKANVFIRNLFCANYTRAQFETYLNGRTCHTELNEPPEEERRLLVDFKGLLDSNIDEFVRVMQDQEPGFMAQRDAQRMVQRTFADITRFYEVGAMSDPVVALIQNRFGAAVAPPAANIAAIEALFAEGGDFSCPISTEIPDAINNIHGADHAIILINHPSGGVNRTRIFSRASLEAIPPDHGGVRRCPITRADLNNQISSDAAIMANTVSALPYIRACAMAIYDECQTSGGRPTDEGGRQAAYDLAADLVAEHTDQLARDDLAELINNTNPNNSAGAGRIHPLLRQLFQQGLVQRAAASAAAAPAAAAPAAAPAPAAPPLPARPVVAAGAIPAGYIPGNEGRLLGFYANRIRRDALPWFGLAPIVRLTNVAEVGPAPGVPGPYHQMHLPQVPVVHPYNPAGDQRIDAGTPQFSFSTTLPQGTVSNLPPAVSALLIQENIDLRNVQCAISMQNKPWNTAVTPLLLRPQPWLHPNAPDVGPYNSVSNIRMAVASVGSHIGPLRAFNNVLTHNEIAGAPVVYSPNSMRLQGLHNENTTDQFYSICIEPAHGGQPARAVITFHTLLSDADQRQVNNILQDPALAINTPENFFAAIAAGGGGINTEELTAFASGGRNLAVERAALVASTITLADGAPVYRDDPLAAAAPARAAGSGAAAAGPAPAAAPRPAPAPQAMPAPIRQTTQQLADELENRYGAVMLERRQEDANLIRIQNLLLELRAELEHAPMDVQNALSTHSAHAIIAGIDQDFAEIFQARLAAIPVTRNAAEQQALAQLRGDVDIAPPAIREVLLRNVNRRFAEDLAARVQAAAPRPAAAAPAPAADVPARPALTADQIRANAVLARLGRPPQYF